MNPSTRKTNHLLYRPNNKNWLVVYLPLWKIWFRQLGGLFPYIMEKMFQATNQTIYYIHLYTIVFVLDYNVLSKSPWLPLVFVQMSTQCPYCRWFFPESPVYPIARGRSSQTRGRSVCVGERPKALLCHFSHLLRFRTGRLGRLGRLGWCPKSTRSYGSNSPIPQMVQTCPNGGFCKPRGSPSHHGFQY